jgi:hypothetical protein
VFLGFLKKNDKIHDRRTSKMNKSLSTIDNNYNMGSKFRSVWNMLFTIFKFGKKRSKQPISDAVRFPSVLEKHIVEDFEVAAYHNQA